MKTPKTSKSSTRRDDGFDLGCVMCSKPLDRNTASPTALADGFFCPECVAEEIRNMESVGDK